MADTEKDRGISAEEAQAQGYYGVAPGADDDLTFAAAAEALSDEDKARPVAKPLSAPEAPPSPPDAPSDRETVKKGR